MTDIRSGRHLGILREWVQRNASNGEHVIWGSEDIVKLKQLSIAELEELAQRIADAAVAEEAERCAKLVENTNVPQSELVTMGELADAIRATPEPLDFRVSAIYLHYVAPAVAAERARLGPCLHHQFDCAVYSSRRHQPLGQCDCLLSRPAVIRATPEAGS